MVKMLLFLGWFTGSSLAVAVLLLGGSGLQVVISILFNALGFGLVMIGAFLIISTLAQRPQSPRRTAVSETGVSD